MQENMILVSLVVWPMMRKRDEEGRRNAEDIAEEVARHCDVGSQHVTCLRFCPRAVRLVSRPI